MTRPCICYNISKVFINKNNILVSIFAIFCILTFAPAQTFFLIKVFILTQLFFLIKTPALASASGSLGRYIDKNLQKATKLILKLFVKGQKYG